MAVVVSTHRCNFVKNKTVLRYLNNIKKISMKQFLILFVGSVFFNNLSAFAADEPREYGERQPLRYRAVKLSDLKTLKDFLPQKRDLIIGISQCPLEKEIHQFLPMLFPPLCSLVLSYSCSIIAQPEENAAGAFKNVCSEIMVKNWKFCYQDAKILINFILTSNALKSVIFSGCTVEEMAQPGEDLFKKIIKEIALRKEAEAVMRRKKREEVEAENMRLRRQLTAGLLALRVREDANSLLMLNPF